jgi:hypothetical protein
MKIYNVKRMSLPKVAVLATGLAAAVMVVTINPLPAQAYPTKTTACTGCHDAGGSLVATPSSAALAPGAAYTVALAFTGGSGGGTVGYWISGDGGNVNGTTSSAAMKAPAVAGSYTYTVWMRDGVASTTTYSITVGAATPPTTEPPATTAPPVTEPPATTAPPVTEPPATTAPPVTEPPATTAPPVTEPPATTAPPVTEPPVTEPPATTAPPVTEPPATTAPPVTEPPATTAPPVTEPPVSSVATIRSLSPDNGVVGSRIKIKGTNFAPGTVMFGTVTATVSSWTSTAIVVKVPAINSVSIGSCDRPVWYRSGQHVAVTVNPTSAAASKAASFFVESPKGHHDRDGQNRDNHDRDHD